MGSLNRCGGIHNLTPTTYIESDEEESDSNDLSNNNNGETTSPGYQSAASVPNIGNAMTIFVRPKVGYGQRKTLIGQVPDQTHSGHQHSVHVKANSRTGTPYPQTQYQVRPKASHGSRDAKNTRVRSLPQDFSKEMSNLSKREATVAFKGLKSPSRSSINNSPLNMTPSQILRLPKSGREMIRETLSNTPFQQRALELFDSGEASRKGTTAVEENKGTVGKVDYWRADDDADDEREDATELSELDKLEEMIYRQVDKGEENSTTNSHVIVTNNKTNDNYISNSNSADIFERAGQPRSDKIRQITFERKYGMPYQSFLLPTVPKKIDQKNSEEKVEGDKNYPPSPGVDDLLRTLGWDAISDTPQDDISNQENNAMGSNHSNKQILQNDIQDPGEDTRSLESLNLQPWSKEVSSDSQSLQMFPGSDTFNTQHETNLGESPPDVQITQHKGIRYFWNKLKTFITKTYNGSKEKLKSSEKNVVNSKTDKEDRNGVGNRKIKEKYKNSILI